MRRNAPTAIRSIITMLAAVAVVAAGLATPAAAQPTASWELTVDEADIRFNDAAAAPSGAVVLGGIERTVNGGVQINAIVRQYSASGSLEWSAGFGGVGTDSVRGVAVDDDGNVYIGGSTFLDGASSSTAYLASYDADGVRRWYVDLDVDATIDVEIAPNGDLVATGWTDLNSGSDQVWTATYTSSGDRRWIQEHGGFGEEEPTDLAVAPDGTIGVYFRDNDTFTGGLLRYNAGGTPLGVTAAPVTGAGGQVAVNSDGVFALVGSGNLVLIAASGQLISNQPFGALQAIAAEADGSFAGLVSSPGQVNVVGLTSAGAEEWRITEVNASYLLPVITATSDGGLVASVKPTSSTIVRRFAGSSLVPVAGFVDVRPTDFFAESVTWLKDEGITTGTSPTTFSPGGNVTRGQMAAFLWRLVGSPTGAPAHGFDDVAAGTFFEEAVRWLKDEGITTGTSPTTFSPGGNVTRGQMAAFLWRLAGSPTGNPAHGFDDVPDGTFFAEAVRWLKSEGITTGTSATTFSPGGNVTRGQMAAFLFRMATDSSWVRPGS